MAETYEIVSQRLTQELVGGHDLVDVWEIGAKTLPGGVYFVFRVGKDQHTAEAVQVEASRRAMELQTVHDHPSVTDLQYVPNIGPNGQLIDEIDVHYTTGDGRHGGAIRTPLHGFSAETVSRHVDEAVNHLDTIRAL